MRRGAAFLIAIAVSSIALATSALALDIQRPGRATPAPTRIMKLTSEECKTLGGSLLKDSSCTSGQKCKTVDQYGLQHYVCLTKGP
jgi:hypothetical protein